MANRAEFSLPTFASLISFPQRASFGLMLVLVVASTAATRVAWGAENESITVRWADDANSGVVPNTDPAPVSAALGDASPRAFAQSELWSSKAIAQQGDGEFDLAAESFAKALQIRRIHEGLHHLNHLPLIESLIKVHEQRRDWNGVDRMYRLLTWVHERESSEQQSSVLARYARWHIRAHQLPTEHPPYQHLLNADAALTKAVAIEESQGGGKGEGEDRDNGLVALLYLRATVAYYIADHMTTWSGDAVTGVVPEAIITEDSLDWSDTVLRRNVLFKAFNDGEAALERALSLEQASRDPGAIAIALAFRGDWELLFNRRRAATNYYAQSQRHLIDAGDRAPFNFNLPVALPATAYYRRQRSKAATEPSNFVRVRFDVSPAGKVREWEFIEVQPPEAKHLAGQVRRMLRTMRYRPRLLDGKPTRAEDVEARFVFPATNSVREPQGNIL
ncbi:MAG: hypothetical protein AAF384_05925 [Pseudomonadota bacterium]